MNSEIIRKLVLSKNYDDIEIGIVWIILLFLLLSGCAPYKKNTDYCSQLKAQKNLVTEKYSPGPEKTELLKAIDSLINQKRCNE